MKCYTCGKEIIEDKEHDKYLFHIIDENGETKFVYGCSEKCCNAAIENNSKLHYLRYDNVSRQYPQRMRADEKC